MNTLTEKKCLPCEGGVRPLAQKQAEALLEQTKGWELNGDATEISKQYKFKNFYETMAFVNALAYIAHQENHHPDIKLGYNYCYVSYHTHAIHGLSENDFICAAKLDTLK